MKIHKIMKGALSAFAALSVAAATVPCKVLADDAMSTLAGDTGLSLIELNEGNGQVLSSGIYYLNESLSFEGADSTDSSTAGGNGLKIAEGATVYIYIPDGITLTVVGGNGYNGTDGENGGDAALTTTTMTDYGITFKYSQYSKSGSGGAGGEGATGGGAGIYLPSDAKLAIFGDGDLVAAGGAGGNAGNGGAGGDSKYLLMSFYGTRGMTASQMNRLWDTNTDEEEDCSGTVTNTASVFYTALEGNTGGGGGAGGGAGGGGAAIGTNGTSGSAGTSGASNNIEGELSGNISKATSAKAAETALSEAAGSAYIACAGQSLTGGSGGVSGTQGSEKENTSTEKIIYLSADGETATEKFFLTHGQYGAGGANGADGAAVGTGGSGGQGGQGGDSGSFAEYYFLGATTYASTSNIGAEGEEGIPGEGESVILEEAQYPYNTVTFTGAQGEAAQYYYMTKGTQISVPDSNIENFAGWSIETAASTLPSVFGESTTGALLESDTNMYLAGDTITVDALAYGDVTLEARVYSEVELNTNGGTINSGAITTYVEGIGATLPTDVTRNGFEFAGWYDNSDFSGEAVTEINSEETGDKAYYAKWNLLEISFSTFADAGYYAESRNAEQKEGIIAFNSFFEQFETYDVEAYGIYVYNSNEEQKGSANSTDGAALKESNGYFHACVTNIPEEYFGTTVLGMPYVVIDGTLRTGEFCTFSVSSSGKWLGEQQETGGEANE